MKNKPKEVLIDSIDTNRVVSGHMRLAVMKDAGWKTVKIDEVVAPNTIKKLCQKKYVRTHENAEPNEVQFATPEEAYQYVLKWTRKRSDNEATAIVSFLEEVQHARKDEDRSRHFNYKVLGFSLKDAEDIAALVLHFLYPPKRSMAGMDALLPSNADPQKPSRPKQKRPTSFCDEPHVQRALQDCVHHRGSVYSKATQDAVDSVCEILKGGEGESLGHQIAAMHAAQLAARTLGELLAVWLDFDKGGSREAMAARDEKLAIIRGSNEKYVQVFRRTGAGLRTVTYKGSSLDLRAQIGMIIRDATKHKHGPELFVTDVLMMVGGAQPKSDTVWGFNYNDAVKIVRLMEYTQEELMN